jgi:hypothetical protein
MMHIHKGIVFLKMRGFMKIRNDFTLYRRMILSGKQAT